MTTEQEWIWLAGLLEGEGYFANRKGRISPVVEINMTDEDVVKRAAEVMECNTLNRPPRFEGYKPQFRALTTGKNAARVMMNVYPYMGKRRQSVILETLAIFYGVSQVTLDK